MATLLEFSPGTENTSSGGISRNINDILSILESPAGSPPDTPVKTESPTQKSNILDGVVAYVEVRGDNENRSRAIERELQQLGANIAHKLDPDVTHVVFKDGKKSTRTRVEKRQLHLVSVLWVESCKQSGCRVPENMFPVAKAEEGTPIFARLKKSKSMQPKDFDEDVANSAERGVKRRKRAELLAERWKKALPNSPSLRRFFVEETQPRSPSSPCGSPDITIPDTPPSMRDRMDKLLRQQVTEERSFPNNTPLLGGKKATSPLQRRLFVNTVSSPEPQVPLIVSPGRSSTTSPRQARGSAAAAAPAQSPSLGSPSSRTRLRSQSSEEESPSLMTRLKKRLSGSLGSPLYSMHGRRSLGVSPNSRRNSATASPTMRGRTSQTEVDKADVGGSVASADEVFLPENKPSSSSPAQVGGHRLSRKRRRSDGAVEESEDPLPPEMKAATVSEEEKLSNPAVRRKGRKSVITPTGVLLDASKIILADSTKPTAEVSATTEFVKPNSAISKSAVKPRGRKSIAASKSNPNSPAIDATEISAHVAPVSKPPQNSTPEPNFTTDVSVDSTVASAKPPKRKLLSLSVSESCLPSFPVEARKSSEASKIKERLFELKKKPDKALKKRPDAAMTVSISKKTTSGRKVKSLSPPVAITKPVRSSRRKSMHPTVPIAPESFSAKNSSPDICATSEASSSNEAAATETRISGRRKSMNPALLRQSEESSSMSSSKNDCKKMPQCSLSGKPEDINNAGKITKAANSNSPQKSKTRLKKSVTLSLKKTVVEDTSMNDTNGRLIGKAEGGNSSVGDKLSGSVNVKAGRRNSMFDVSVIDKKTAVDVSTEPKNKANYRRRSVHPRLSDLCDEKSGSHETTTASNRRTNAAAANATLPDSTVPNLPLRRRSVRRSLVPNPMDISTQNLVPTDLESTTSLDTGISSTTDEPESRLKENTNLVPGPSLPRPGCHDSDSGMSDVDSEADTLSEVSLPQLPRKVSISFWDETNNDITRTDHRHSMSTLASEVENSAVKPNRKINNGKSPKRKVCHNKRSTAKPAGVAKVFVKPQKQSKSSTSSKKSNTLNQDKKANKPTLVMTSLHFPEQDSVRAVVKKLGGFHLVDKVLDSTTHVVIGNNRRTLNVLYGLVQGCWMLSLEWVLKSLEADTWLPEKGYETDFFPIAQMYRQEREGSPKAYQPQLFHEQGVIFVTEETAPPADHIIKLITMAGGQVTSCVRKADFSIGLSSRSDLKAVAEQWVLDSITSHQCLPHDEYELGIKNRLRSPSPDF